MNSIFLHSLSGRQLDRTVVLSIFSLHLLPPFLFYTFYEASSDEVIFFSVKNYKSSIIPKFNSYLSCVDYEEHHSMYFFCSFRFTLNQKGLSLKLSGRSLAVLHDRHEATCAVNAGV